MGAALPSSQRAVRSVLLSLLGLASLPGCWVSSEQGRAFEADIVKLKAEYAQQNKDLADVRAKADRDREKLRAEQDEAIKRMDAKVQEVSAALDRLNHAALKTGADLAVDLEKAQKDIDSLRGMIEELQAKNTGYEQFRQDALAKLKQLDDQQAAAAKKAAELPTTKDAFYDLAKLKLDNGNYSESRSLFSQFLKKWGDDPLAANAQYWIGESYYGEKNFRQAGIEFQKVRDQYPKSDKAPDALLKVAYAFIELNLRNDAKLFLEEVQREYPKSSAAKLAKEKLAELGKHSKQG